MHRSKEQYFVKRQQRPNQAPLSPTFLRIWGGPTAALRGRAPCNSSTGHSVVESNITSSGTKAITRLPHCSSCCTYGAVIKQRQKSRDDLALDVKQLSQVEDIWRSYPTKQIHAVNGDQLRRNTSVRFGIRLDATRPDHVNNHRQS